MSEEQKRNDIKKEIKELIKQTYDEIDSDIEGIYEKKKKQFKRS